MQRTLLIGANRQYGQFVFGGEARFAFGDFGRDFSASTSTSLSDSASSWVTGVSSGGTTADWFDLYEYLSIVDFTDNTSISNDPIPNVPYGDTPTSSILTGTGDAATLWNYSEISWANSWNGEGYTNNTTVYAQYYQTSTFHAGVNFNRIMSPTLRAGITAGKAMFFVMGGPSYAKVTAHTSASITETSYVADNTLTASDSQVSQTVDWSVGTTYDSSGTGLIALSQQYDFSGSNKQSLLGYTLGLGMEYALNDKWRLRLEGEYHDLGSISVTGASQTTGANYTVNQDITGSSISAGLTYRF